MKNVYKLLATSLVAGLALAGCSPAPEEPESLTRSVDNVAILVVDDFGHGKDPNAQKGVAAENCAMGTSDVISGGADDGLLPAGASHGRTVYDVLKAQVRGLESTAVGTPLSYLGTPALTEYGVAAPWWGTPRLDAWSYGGGKVALVEVHVDKYLTADLIAGIRGVIGSMTGFQRFVLNLSFAVIPCDIGSWLEQAGAGGDAALLAKYLELIKADPDLAGLETLLTSGGTGNITATVLEHPELAPLRPVMLSDFYQLFVTSDVNSTYQEALTSRREQVKPAPRAEVLQQLFEDPGWQEFATDAGLRDGPGQGKRRVVPVAAAGNGIIVEGRRIRPSFPFAPALWPGVVSVSSDGGYSNYGEVEMDGAGPAEVDTGTGIVAVSIRGTSYAAPRLAALEAVYLLTGGPVRCDGPRPPQSSPPLKYASLTDARPGWLNRLPAAIAADHCAAEWSFYTSLS